MAIRDLKAVVYTTDTGEQFQTAIDAAVFAQTTGDPAVPIVGGEDYDGSPELDPLPRQIVPRKAYVVNGTNRRAVVCLTADAPLYATGGVTSVNLQVLGASAVTYTKVRSKREEDKRRFRNPAG